MNNFGPKAPCAIEYPSCRTTPLTAQECAVGGQYHVLLGTHTESFAGYHCVVYHRHDHRARATSLDPSLVFLSKAVAAEMSGSTQMLTRLTGRPRQLHAFRRLHVAQATQLSHLQKNHPQRPGRDILKDVPCFARKEGNAQKMLFRTDVGPNCIPCKYLDPEP